MMLQAAVSLDTCAQSEPALISGESQAVRKARTRGRASDLTHQGLVERERCSEYSA